MISSKKLKPILESYKTFFYTRWETHEKFKWEAVKHFQNNWDINAPDFGEMFKYATKLTDTLLDNGYEYPRRLIIDFAKADNDGIRRMFQDLYDETKKLSVRIEDFQTAAEGMRKKYYDGTWKKHYQNTSAISTYLWLNFPDQYYIYKYEIFKDVADELEADWHPKRNGSVETMLGGYAFYDEICKAVQNDKDICEMVAGELSKFEGTCWQDKQFRTTTIDIGFYINQKRGEERKQKRKPAIWKISHGGLSDEHRLLFEKRKVAVVHGMTGAKGVSKVPQGQSFVDEIKDGDYFYLCYGNSIQLLGQFVGDQAVLNPEKQDGWYERPYRIMSFSKDKSPYTNTVKWWTPNENSTCIRVGENEKTLFEELILRPYFDMTLESLYGSVPVIADNGNQKYTKEDFLNEVYMSEERYNLLKALLLNKMNVILQGAPGVGKTFSAKRLAYSIMGEMDDSKIELIQFHQNYSYEDFVMGYRPDGADFKLTEGIFYRFCKKAEKDSGNKYFFIIDEINRGNMSKIFGELLMLIEKDYRGTEAKLAYSGLSFSVPTNLYLIGMMNTADRSLAMIDYALRRRFSFFEIEPGFASDGFRIYQESLENETFDALIEQIQSLNKEIVKDKSLGKGFQIGHSYFCGRKPEQCTTEWMQSVVQFDILPMLAEYWFDEPEQLSLWEKRLNGVFDDER